VLLPAIVLAFAVMLLSGRASSHAQGRRFEASALEELPSAIPEPPAPRVAAAGAIDLALRLEKQLGSFRLSVDWSPRRPRLAILGPSGSGKSLTLKIIAGIESCDHGVITAAGKDISALPPQMRPVAYVPQNYGLFPHLCVTEQLRFPRGADPDLAKLWIDRLALRGLERRRPDALSLGQQQRVALARALVRPARLLLLDEPFSALDAPLRSSLRQQMLTLQSEVGATMILVTHDPAEAALLADEILLLEGGRVLQTGATEQVFARPVNELAARLLGAEFAATGIAAEPNAIAVGDDVLLAVAGPPLQPGQHVGWSAPSARVRVSGHGRYLGRVEHVISLGMGRQLAIRFGKSLVHALVGDAEFSLGSACRFDIDPDAVRVWPLDERLR
jgi:ABC-type Fe3+/spermidine/putrescine transport system ATPase subunit